MIKTGKKNRRNEKWRFGRVAGERREEINERRKRVSDLGMRAKKEGRIDGRKDG